MKPNSASITRLHDPTIRELLQRWAAWRRQGRLGAEVGWSNKTLTGKLLDGLRGTRCPTCGGLGTMPGGRFRAKPATLVCSTCDGEGKILLDREPEKANPALIRPTYRGSEEHTLVLVDHLVCALRQGPKTQKHFLVLWAEYVSQRYATQQRKADGMGISHSYYRKLVHETHALIERGLRAQDIHVGGIVSAHR
jgi:hypothetical protein